MKERLRKETTNTDTNNMNEANVFISSLYHDRAKVSSDPGRNTVH